MDAKPMMIGSDHFGVYYARLLRIRNEPIDRCDVQITYEQPDGTTKNLELPVKVLNAVVKELGEGLAIDQR